MLLELYSLQCAFAFHEDDQNKRKHPFIHSSYIPTAPVQSYGGPEPSREQPRGQNGAPAHHRGQASHGVGGSLILGGRNSI